MTCCPAMITKEQSLILMVNEKLWGKNQDSHAEEGGSE